MVTEEDMELRERRERYASGVREAVKMAVSSSEVIVGSASGSVTNAFGVKK
jgi:hypothetical protein